VLRVFRDGPAGTGDFFSCRQWEVLALELEAVRPDECVTCDETSQCELGFTGDAVGVCLAVYYRLAIVVGSHGSVAPTLLSLPIASQRAGKLVD
jgi:hypothetical protein